MSAKFTKKPLKTVKSKLKNLTDKDIDYSDIPATDKNFWKDAELYLPSHKIHLSLRLDEEIVSYFKKQGPGYQSRINAILKAYVHAHSKHK